MVFHSLNKETWNSATNKQTSKVQPQKFILIKFNLIGYHQSMSG